MKGTNELKNLEGCNIMGKKQLKTIKRKETLEEAVRFGLAFCTHHNYLLDPDDIWKHRCYTGNHGNNYCQYLKIQNEIREL